MSSKGKISIFVGVGLFVVGLLLVLIFNHQAQNSKDLILYGNVDIRQVDLGFRVFGRIQALSFDEGDEVKAGQLMAVLDKTPYEEAVWAAEAKVGIAEASLKNAQAKLQKRIEVVTGAISREDYDNAVYNLETLKSTLDEAKAEKATALTNLKDTQIFCPTLGTILTRIREPGSVVNVGEPVFTLSVASPVWIRAYISEPDLGKIYPGMPADVTIDTKPSHVYQGHIGFISPVAEFTPKSVETTELRTDLVYRLRIIIEKPDSMLHQGMPVTVKLTPSPRK